MNLPFGAGSGGLTPPGAHADLQRHGGAGQIAITEDPYNDNTSLIAVTRDFVANGTNLPLQEVIVCRYNYSTGAEDWTHAGYIDPTNTNNGKRLHAATAASSTAREDGSIQWTSSMIATAGATLVVRSTRCSRT